jgi:hypothetical protein
VRKIERDFSKGSHPSTHCVSCEASRVPGTALFVNTLCLVRDILQAFVSRDPNSTAAAGDERSDVLDERGWVFTFWQDKC